LPDGCENVAGQDLIDVGATHRHRVFPMQIEIAFSARKIWLIASLAERMPLAELRSVANDESSRVCRSCLRGGNKRAADIAAEAAAQFVERPQGPFCGGGVALAARFAVGPECEKRKSDAVIPGTAIWMANGTIRK
jgi:hypothetical protein